MRTPVPQRSRGRPIVEGELSSARPQYSSEQSESATARALRAEYEQMPPAKQRETIARVQLLLEDERMQHTRQLRNNFSPLARMAWRAYGIWLDWVPPLAQVDSYAELKSTPAHAREKMLELALRSIVDA